MKKIEGTRRFRLTFEYDVEIQRDDYGIYAGTLQSEQQLAKIIAVDLPKGATYKAERIRYAPEGR